MQVFVLFSILLASVVGFAQNRCGLRSELRSDIMSGQISASPGQNSYRDFTKTAHKIQKEFAEDFARRGQVLKVVTDWSTDEQNAFASQEGKEARVHLLGGYARDMHEDSFLMVACHEIGHHLAGPPYYSYSMGSRRMSTEGQSDYFAASKCLRRLWKNEDNRAYVQRHGTHYAARIDCNHAWGTNTNESFLCMRTIMAAMNLRLRHLPNRRDLVNQRDYTKVVETLERHPAAQCRFDTHRAGALCPLSEGVTESNCRQGRVRQGAGARPSCWYYK